jgi:septal ring factor EnvC (AmiA/AmiB activator)
LEAQISVISAVSVLCTVLGFCIAFLTFNRNRDKEVKTDASELAVIKTKLDTISAGVTSIQVDIKTNERRVTELSERLIRVEESSKQAHKRIDFMENKGGVLNE